MSDVLISTVEYGTGGGRPPTVHLLQASTRPAGRAPGLVWVHGGAFLERPGPGHRAFFERAVAGVAGS